MKVMFKKTLGAEHYLANVLYMLYILSNISYIGIKYLTNIRMFMFGYVAPILAGKRLPFHFQYIENIKPTFKQYWGFIANISNVKLIFL